MMRKGAGLVTVWTLAVVLGACAGPGAVLDLADASTDGERRSAVAKAAQVLSDPGQKEARRVAAAWVLGRLRRPAEAAISALSLGLDGRTPEAVRIASAFALGELRTSESLDPLVAALASPHVSERLGRHLLQAIAKHAAVLAGQPGRAVALAESMTRFGASLRAGSVPPPALDLISARVRTLEVDVRVLERAVAAYRARPRVDTGAALYAAAFELLSRLETDRAQLAVAQARVRVAEAVDTAHEAALVGERDTERLVLWFLGRVAEEPLYARPSARALAKAASQGGAGVRLLRAWALARSELVARTARRALTHEVLLAEGDSAVLSALMAAVPEDSARDLLQRVLSVELSP